MIFSGRARKALPWTLRGGLNLALNILGLSFILEALNPMSTIWSFDLGKASIGEAVRDTKTNEFLHKASLLIPAEFASTKDAATRRRMWRTRQAHKAREAWLDDVWRAAGQEPLRKREVWRNPTTKKWELKHPADERLEREFSKKGDAVCYTSCLLRIKLLRGEKMEPWQIYKALHSAIQRRGYGRVPWAGRDLGKRSLTEEEVERELRKFDDDLGKKDPAYKAAVEAWPAFKREVSCALFHFPCYYDAAKMGLWNPREPDALAERIDFRAETTRRVRFDRFDVEREIAMLARNGATQLPALAQAFAKWRQNGWTLHDPETGRQKTFPVMAEDFGTFLVYGPAGELAGAAQNNFGAYLDFRAERNIHPGSRDDWMGATAQKTPRFDNRIINGCALLPPDRFQVCKAEPQLNLKTGQPHTDSLLHCEAVCVMKLKNLRVTKDGEQRMLFPKELRGVFEKLRADALAVRPNAKDWAQKVADRFAITEKDWGNKKAFAHLGLRPVPGHEELRAPNVRGRSRYSRPALRLIRALVLGGQKPSIFRARLHARESELLAEIGLDFRNAPLQPRANIDGGIEHQRCAYVRPDDLKFLDDLIRAGDTWEKIHFPEQRLDALEAQNTDDEGQLDRDAAIRAVLGSINDPIVRHRLAVFAKRLKALQFGTKHNHALGVPERIVLEFIRTDFMGDEAKFKLRRFQDEREKARKEAREQTLKLGVSGHSAALRYQLWKSQGCVCLYTGEPLIETNLDNYEIDHIVPRSLGGPDAQVNYVLTFHDINSTKEKGALTPYALLHGKEGWDSYEKRVKSHLTTLRSKKAQLLLRQDAPELVERYTALAETAWISRLAQKVASLHFGWRNGIDYGGKDTKQRIVVISGGLTARVRRKYCLNSLLAPCPQGVDRIDWEEKAEKNRNDDRHHALDAMVINFLESWVRNPSKEQWFRFPPDVHKNAKAFFAEHLKSVVPEPIAAQKPVLEEKFYAERISYEGKGKKPVTKASRRLERVEDLPYKTEKMKRVFDVSFKTAIKRIENIRDDCLREIFRKIFVEQQPDESTWSKLCKEGFFQTSCDGRKGSRIRRLMLDRGTIEEYRDMSKHGKDGRPALCRGEPHRGFVIFRNAQRGLNVRPVYAHESPAKVQTDVAPSGGAAQVIAFVFSGCLIETTASVPKENIRLVERNEAKQKRRISASSDLPASRYILRQIVTRSHAAELDTPDGKRIMTDLENLVKAGLKFVRNT